MNSRGFLWTIFGFVFAGCIFWALKTSHVWEDFWITFRSSKNLVAGHGLVFNPGDRLHTFTSPLGVLIPALMSALSGAENDLLAIWLYRLVNITALALSAVLLCSVARRLRFGIWGMAVLILMLAWDAKSIDFTINGMETGILLGFLAYTFWSMFLVGERRWVHLGCAWAGLMWTRPDSFIYIGLLSIGLWLFNTVETTGLTRRQWIRVFLQAGLLCTVLYLPWFLWAWGYYGTPVPHTVIAKGGVTDPRSLSEAIQTLLHFPQLAWQGKTSLEGTFLASYYQIGGWPVSVVWGTRILAMVVAIQWLFPWRCVVRLASFAFLGIHFYLSYYPFFPFPWYLPGTALLAAVVIGGMVDGIGNMLTRWRAKYVALGTILLRIGAVCAMLLVVGQAWLSLQMMRQMVVEQELSANEVRRKTGEWLSEHARPTDTVLMEPLGHIGYFSGLRTLDLPGLSSRESVRGMKLMKELGWGYVADYLSPDWIVLRETEMLRLQTNNWQLLGHTYKRAAEFDTSEQIKKQDVWGKGYLLHDSHWIVFKRIMPKRYRLDLSDPEIQANYPLPVEAFDGGASYKLHASGVMSVVVPSDATHLSVGYGLPASTYTGDVVTDGVGFVLYFVNDDDEVTVLLDRELDPLERIADRGIQHLETNLPSGQNREIIMVCTPGPTNLMDWSCWDKPEFR